jgi:2-oxoisovalerate dehydrogenase E1 component
MPCHWSNPELNIFTQSSAVTTQCLHAVGCAEAGKYYSRHPDAAKKSADDYRAFKDVRFHGDEVVYVSLGDGATSEGEFWEAISTASNLKLPVLFVIEDNGYAISVPVEVNTPGGNISKLVANFPNFFFAEVDGTDPIASYEALCRAADHCRSGLGPAFVHGHVVRLYSHSFSDDDRAYRSDAEREADGLRDPISKLQMRLLRDGILDTEQINRLEREVDEQVRVAGERAEMAALPAVESLPLHIYSENMDPTSLAIARPAVTASGSAERTMADLINACLKDEMRRDPRILVFGEDVADASRSLDSGSSSLKGKGGVFKLTAGLQWEFGPDRVFNSPLAEANIVGRALGMAARGLKPVVEIQFFD